MATVLLPYNQLPPHHLTNTTQTTANSGLDPVNEFEKQLRLCEANAIPEADAQEVIDKLDQILKGKLDLGRPDLPKKKQYLVTLTKICKVYCFVPTSHLVLDSELEKLGDSPFKSEEDSNVWPGCYRGQEVSIKVLVRHVADDEMVIKRRFCRETVIWGRMSHPNILPLIGVIMSKELAVVSPWMEDGNVMDYLRENHEANPVKLLEESVLGLQYLHGIGIVHGGLQGRHILVTDNGHACLSDIGRASIIREQDNSDDDPTPLTSGTGNLRYSPPEYTTDDPSSKSATTGGDIYSMGMTIYEVLTDRRPFHECSSWSVVLRIIKGTRPKRPDFATSRGYTKELWELTTTCWQQDPTKRPTIDKLLESLGDGAMRWEPRKDEPFGVGGMDYQTPT